MDYGCGESGGRRIGVMYGRGGRGCGGQRWDGIIIGQTDTPRAGRLTGRMGMRDGSDGTKEATFFRGHTKVASIELSIVVRDLSISDKV